MTKIITSFGAVIVVLLCWIAVLQCSSKKHPPVSAPPVPEVAPTPAPPPEVIFVEPEPEAITEALEPVIREEPPKKETWISEPDRWSKYLVGEWLSTESVPEVRAKFTQMTKKEEFKEDGKMIPPWHVLLSQPREGAPKGVQWSGCSFYYSGMSFCELAHEKGKKIVGKIMIEHTVDDTDVIRVNALNGDFLHTLRRLK